MRYTTYRFVKISKSNSWRRKRERESKFLRLPSVEWILDSEFAARCMHISSPMVKLCVHPRLATSCAIIKLPVWPWQPQGQKTKRRVEEKKIIIPLPHGACTERDTRTGCNVFDLHSRMHTPTPASHYLCVCVYLDAPLIVIRSII